MSKDALYFHLDWSTRHLKNFQKQHPHTNEHHYEALYMYGVMKTTCELLDIDNFEWCKAVKIPYRRRHEGYEQLFSSTIPFDIKGKPMEAYGTYFPVIKKLEGTKPKWS